MKTVLITFDDALEDGTVVMKHGEESINDADMLASCIPLLSAIKEAIEDERTEADTDPLVSDSNITFNF